MMTSAEFADKMSFSLPAHMKYRNWRYISTAAWEQLDSLIEINDPQQKLSSLLCAQEPSLMPV